METIDVRVLGPHHVDSEYASEGLLVEIGGRKYLRETWFTRSSGGVEWYDGETFEWIDGPDLDDEEIDEVLDRMDSMADALDHVYTTKYNEQIAPLVNALREEVYG